MRRTWTLRATIVLAVALALRGQPLFAQETELALLDDGGRRVVLGELEVNEMIQPDPRFPQVLKQIDEGKISAGKKTTAIELDAQPEVIANNLRQTFARTPGLLISEQQVPSSFNVNYRGLGDPHESEFVMFLENGIPIVSDWFGYPTLYYTPPTQRVERVELIRGGAGLLYGPQVGPVVNFVAHRAEPGAEHELRSEHVLGADGLYSTFNDWRGGSEHFGAYASIDHRHGDGPRTNGDFSVDGASAGLAWAPDAGSLWRLDIYGYESASGEAGRLTQAQYVNDRDLTTTPFNRIWIERHNAVLSHQRELGESTELIVKLWHGYQDRYSRRAAAFVAPQAPPTSTTFDRQEFRYDGLDLRLVRDWGANHSLTAGLVGYLADSPRSQSRATELSADNGPTLRYKQERDTRYAALFVENIFRFGALSLVPAVRLESLTLGIGESVPLASLRRAPIDAEFSHEVPLFGFGANYEFVGGTELYANVSEGYRPMRYDDVGNPSAELVANNDPEPSDAINYEVGVRGSAWSGFYYDVSAFRIDLSNKIEQRLINANDIERVNSGDSRHQGVEAAGEYDLMRAFASDRADSLALYGSLSLLDAEFTASENPALVGRTPAFAPDHVAKLGLIYRNAERLKLALSGTLVDEHFWQDSNLPQGSGAGLIEAVVPAYQVWDFSAEFRFNARLRLLGGISNLFDERYYARVRSDGIEPGLGRNYYAGLDLSF